MDLGQTPAAVGQQPTDWQTVSGPSDWRTVTPTSSTPPPPVPQHQGLTEGLAENAKGEGVYQMKDATGHVQAIPFSNVRKAAQTGMLFTDRDQLKQYAKDYEANPIDEGVVDHYLRTAPWWDVPSHIVNQLSGMGGAALQTATAFDAAPKTSAAQDVQLAAARPGANISETRGEVAEQMGEFFTGDELLSILKGSKLGVAAASASEKLKQATGLAQMLEKNPLIAKLLRVGVTVAKNGGQTGAQTFVHTGGDVDASINAAEWGAGGAALAEMGAPALRAVGQALAGNGAAAPGEAEFANEARTAVRPHLENVRDAIGNAATETPAASSSLVKSGNGIVRSSGAATATVEQAVKARPSFDVDQVLNTVHDFTGAGDRLADVNNAAYEALDQATGGKFRKLNGEVADAQKAAWRGGGTDQQLYENKLAEMDRLLNESNIKPDLLKTIKASWRQSYQLKDFGDIWDRAINGVPGASQASQAQRGINGQVLMNGLQRAVRMYGRPAIESSLGQGRLENLENIARLNQTSKARQLFNNGAHSVAKYLPMYLGAHIGGHIAGLPGEIAGATMGAFAQPGAERVLNAVRANPKIGQFFTYAIDSGADPAKYGPMLAGLIVQEEKQSQQQQPSQDDTGEK